MPRRRRAAAESNASLIVGAILLGIILVGCFVLVAIDKLATELFFAVVVGPSVGGVIGHISGAKGVQQGAEAATDPPPRA
jgi:hypothetical protein